MATCDLCELPTPNPPITRDGIDGRFCCHGCLEVATQLGDIEDVGPGTVRDALESEPAVDDGIESANVETAFLAVDGMHCATCEAFIEATVTKHDGVAGAEASYAADVVRLTYDPDRITREELPGLIDGLGYSARDVRASASRESTPPWRLLIGGFVGMTVMAWYIVFLYPRYFGLVSGLSGWGTDPIGIASLLNLWFLTTIVLGFTGFPILRGAYVSLRAGHPNMDLLIALAAVSAYAYSTVVVVVGGTDVYFDITVVIVLVVTLGTHYEDRIKRRASSGLTKLTEERVEVARRRTPDGPERIGVDDLDGGDQLVVKPGERVPTDGTIIEGTAAVDESLVTGESVPIRKTVGDDVLGGTVVTDSALVVEVAEDATSTIDRLVTMLWEVQSSRPGIQRVADRIAAVFVPLVLSVAIVAFAWQIIAGTGVALALLTGLTVLVVSCPCALGLATPLAVAAGIRSGLDRGIIVTDASVFETAGDVDIVAFDKTGTLTTGEMRVVDAPDAEAMRFAAAVEQYSNHPIAGAVTSHTAPPNRAVSAFTHHAGRGVSADVDGRRVVVGHPDLFEEYGWALPEDLEDTIEGARTAGRVPVVIGWDDTARSVAVVGDRPRDGWTDVVAKLADRGHEIAVITGDDERSARAFREHPDIEYVFAGVPPGAKAEIIKRLQLEGTTAMVGDGTNDAPALATADLGIALATGTAIAADAADVVIRSDDLAAVSSVFDVVAETNRRIRQNLGWAFLYNVIAIPVAAAGHINPLIAAGAMATSSLLVVGNSTRSVIDDRDVDQGSYSKRSVER